MLGSGNDEMLAEQQSGCSVNVLVLSLISLHVFLILQALHNTQLLASYAAIDPRVKQLCYVMKVFSKVGSPTLSPLQPSYNYGLQLSKKTANKHCS